MANVNRIISSNHKFTDPIRLFKGNDPYQFQVDNIPLEQLQENTRWLKDQILNFDIEATELDRSNWGELQPCFSGTGRTVTVSPGRYTSRINDAYGASALQEFSFVNSTNFWDGVSREFESTATQVSNVTSVLDSLINGTGTGKVSINGLEMRAIDWLFSRPLSDSVDSYETDSTGYPGWSTSYLPNERAWPLLDTRFLSKGLLSKSPVAKLDESQLGQFLQDLSMQFVRKWRGISRLSVVDVPKALTLEIPEFSDNDFFTIAEDGTVTNSGGTVRIDLLFVYSKPIDADSAAIQTGTTVRTITTPELGLVKGAGLGFRNQASYFELVNRDVSEKNTFFDVETGGYKIAADLNNENSSTIGFDQGILSKNDVRGTFPSPDDPLNLAPQLLNDLESSDFRLLGQTVLPIAYIVVNKPSIADIVSVTGQYPLTNDSIIDIRPFFRTAELTYNERSGIAAALPQLSMANPAVGKAELQQSILEVRRSLQEIEQHKNSSVIAKGTIYGGILYGPEGAILKEDGLDFSQVYDANGRLSILAQSTLDAASINEDVKVPLYPQWGLAQHSLSDGNAGSYLGDWMDSRILGNRPTLDDEGNPVDNVPYGYDDDVRATLGLPQNFRNPDAITGMPGWSNGRPMMIRYSRKIIYVHNIPDWVKGISIRAEYINCFPTQGDGEFPGVGGITVGNSAIYGPGEVGPTYGAGKVFPTRSCKVNIISWSAGHSGIALAVEEQLPIDSRNNPAMSAYLVTRNTLSNDGVNDGIKLNKCMYPTVDFTIIGTNSDVASQTSTEYGLNPNDFPEEAIALTPEQIRVLLTSGYTEKVGNIKAH